MNKQEALEQIEQQKEAILQMQSWAFYGYIEGLVKQLDEPQKVAVPQFVADYIKYAIENDWDFQDLFKCIEDEEDEELLRWVYHERNQEMLAAAWINGYEVKKEKRYEVILSNGQSLKTVYRQGDDRLDFEKVYGDLERFTRKQLEDAGLAWVFDCPGVKVKEVEE